MPRWPATHTRLPLRRYSVRVVIASVLPLHGDEIGLDHLAHELFEARLVSPAEPLARLRGVAEEEVDFGGSIVVGVDFDQHLTGRRVASLLVATLAPPFEPPAGLRKGELHELAHRMRLAGREHVVVGFGL